MIQRFIALFLIIFLNLALLPEDSFSLGGSCGTVASCCCEVKAKDPTLCDGKTIPVMERADCACHGDLARSAVFLKIDFELSFLEINKITFNQDIVLSFETKQKASFVSSLERPPRHSFLFV